MSSIAMPSFPPALPPSRRPGHAPCMFCPFGADRIDHNVKRFVRGRTFDLRTSDGVWEGLEALLKCFGATVVVGPRV